MRYMAKPIISNILLFIESLLLFSITIIFSLKLTILNEKYVIKKLEKTNYYEYVYEETKNTMTYITKKSSIPSEVLENTFSLEDIKKDVNSFIKSFYKGEKVNINTEHLKENLNKNLENQEIEQNKLTDYTNKMISTYKNEIRLMNSFEENSIILNKYNKISTILLLLLIADLTVLIIINKKIFKKAEYNVLLYTSALSLIGTNIFINILNINNLFIYNNKVSQILKTIINSFQIKNFMFILLYIILGLKIIEKNNKEPEEETE